MIVKKKKETKEPTSKEPEDRFCVRKWQATDREMSEIRKYVKSKKSNKKLSPSDQAKRIIKKVIRNS